MTERQKGINNPENKSKPSYSDLYISYIEKLLDRASQLKKKDPQQALEFCTKAFIQSKDADYTPGIGTSYFYSGIAKSNIGDFENSLIDLFNALDVFESLSDNKNISGVLNAIGMTYNSMQEYQKAIDFYEQSIKSTDTSNQFNDTIAATYNNLGISYQNIGNLSNAIDNYLQSLKIYKTIDDEQGEAVALSNIGIIHSLQNNNTNAVKYFQEALEKKLKNGADNSSILNTVINIANAAMKNNDAAVSKENFKKALEFKEEIKDEAVLFSIYDSLGKLEIIGGNYEDAIKYYKEASKLINEEDNEEEYINVMQNLSVAYELKQDYKKALKSWIAYQDKWKDFIVKKYTTEINELKENVNSHKEIVQNKLESELEQNVDRYKRKLEIYERENNKLKNEVRGFIKILETKIKKPMIDILGFSQILRSEENQFSKPEIKSLLVETERQAKQSSEYVSNLIDFKLIELGLKNFQIISLNLSSVINSVINSHKLSAKERNIKLIFKSDPDYVFIKSDRNSLLQIFDNLISNSISISPNGKEIFIKVLDKDSTVRCEIKDQGSGFTKEEINRLLNKDVITEVASIDELNLVMVNKLSKALDCLFWCESEPGSGSSFVLEFPKTAT